MDRMPIVVVKGVPHYHGFLRQPHGHRGPESSVNWNEERFSNVFHLVIIVITQGYLQSIYAGVVLGGEDEGVPLRGPENCMVEWFFKHLEFQRKNEPKTELDFFCFGDLRNLISEFEQGQMLTSIEGQSGGSCLEKYK